MNDYEIVIFLDETMTFGNDESLLPVNLTSGILNWYTEHYPLNGMRVATLPGLIPGLIPEASRWMTVRSLSGCLL